MLNLYQTKNRVNDLNKSFTQLRLNIDITATEPIAPDDMYLLIGLDVFNLKANYAYIPIFERYYFLTYEIDGSFVKCHLSCDPLMSFKPDVLEADIIADRSSSNFNRYLPDGYIKNLNIASKSVARFKNVFRTGESGTHYLLRVGGR